MAVLGVIIVVRAIEISRHDGDIVGAVLTIEKLAILETGDLGEGVGLVGLLELAGEQAALGHGLWRHAGVDARGAKELELLAAVLPSGMNDVHLEDHVVVHEVGLRRRIAHDASYLGGSKEDVLGLLFFEKLLYLILSCKIKFFMSACNYIFVPLFL